MNKFILFQPFPAFDGDKISILRLTWHTVKTTFKYYKMLSCIAGAAGCKHLIPQPHLVLVLYLKVILG